MYRDDRQGSRKKEANPEDGDSPPKICQDSNCASANGQRAKAVRTTSMCEHHQVFSGFVIKHRQIWFQKTHTLIMRI